MSAATVYVIGEPPLVEELTAVGLNASTKPEEKNEKQHCLDYR
jgi:ribonucleotide monophosphatase NagD (HAD superfamily)